MIRVRCPHCSKLLGVGDNKAGQAVPCPVCKRTVPVPADARPDTVVPISTGTAPPMPSRIPPAPPKKPVLDNLEIVEDEPVHDLDDADMVEAPTDYEEDAPAGPRKKKKNKGGTSSAGGKEVVSGILMMVGAVVWFFGALVWMNRIFFYPPILFVLGIGAVVRGLTNRE
jgi:hypothetical protein